jgi:mRNA-degrading endonuclease toxin of MazEF toxin-antitoxin module
MMAWHSEPDERVQPDWQVRSAKKREELSRSIEETLADNVLIQNPFSDEADEALQDSKYPMIIPPKLSLQSKPMPVVRVESKDVNNVTSRTTTDPVAVPQTTQKKRRLAGRTTKVHLQAVPKSEKKSAKISIEAEKSSSGFEPEGQINGKSNSKRNSSSERGAAAKGKMGRAGSLAGSGTLKQGQQDVMITNTHISSSSVVIVSLVEDPGPVVVKYISLHPQVGFTLHFSDSAEAEARFNYVILMGELF